MTLKKWIALCITVGCALAASVLQIGVDALGNTPPSLPR